MIVIMGFDSLRSMPCRLYGPFIEVYLHQPNVEMPAERKQEFKTRLASVLWDAVEECVQRLDAEGIKEMVRQ